MRGITSYLVAATLATVTVPSTAQSGAPTQAIVQQLIDKMYLSDGHDIQFHVIQITAPHRASAWEGRQFQVSLSQPIYPLRVAYTTVSGSGPSAYVRDYDQHYFIFRSAQKSGAWDLTKDGQPGDVNGNLRGG